MAQAVARPDAPDAPSAATPGGRRRFDLLLALLALLGVVALVTGVSLPLAPVRHDRPVVSWPQDPSSPVSSSLVLAAQTPDAMRVSANCAAVRAAGDSADGVLFAGQRPEVARAQGQSIIWEVRGDRAVLTVQDRQVADVPVPGDGDCQLVAELRDGRIGVTLDGTPVGRERAAAPRLDSLVTSVGAATAGTGQQLSVQVAVNDEFASSPTPLKLVLIGLLLVSGALLLVGLWLLDRRSRRGPPPAIAAAAAEPLPRWRAALRPVSAHVVVVAGLALWTALAPMTDDDGYYAAMARNVPASGFVGQYFQLFDQSFVPLTWPWYVLAGWEQLGSGPVFLRIPAFALCVATWFALRRALDLLLATVPTWRRGDRPDAGAKHRAVWLLAVVYAAAAAPFVMGVRPEGVVAALAAWTLVGVLTALRSRRLLPLAIAVVLAALSCAAHPTGLVAVAPLVAFLPRLWTLVRAGGTGKDTGLGARVATAVRALAVIAPGAMASASGFSDGTLFDYRQGREIFTAIEEPLRWTDEYVRYSFLLNPNIPMGAYAKRTTVLVGIVAIVATLLLGAAARRTPATIKEVRPTSTAVPPAAGLPAELAAVGFTGLLAYLALWITPSKWTHHFGSLSGLLPLLVVLLVLLGPPAAARLWPRPGLAPRLGLLVAVVVVAALSFRGPNIWPYNWLLGMPFQGDLAESGAAVLTSPVLWVLVAVVAVLLARLVLRRRRSPADPFVVGAAATAVVALGVTVAFLGSTFAAAAYGTRDTYSPGAASLRDPFNRQCDAASAIQVADPAQSRALPVVAGRAEVDGFDVDGGWWNGDPLPGTVGTGAFPQVWGSLRGTGDDNTGQLATGWYDLSALSADDYLTVVVAGRLAGANELRVEWGVRDDGDDGDVRVVRSRAVDDLVDSPEWRSVRLLRPGQEAPREATLVRLTARDAGGGTGGWLAVSAPVAQPAVRLADWLPRDAVVITSWQFTYLFSCQQQPEITDGVVERPQYAVLWGPNALQGTNDAIWQYGRGGIVAPLPDAATLYEPVSEFAYPELRQVGQWGQVAELTYPYAADAYDLRLEPETDPGWQAPSVPSLG